MSNEITNDMDVIDSRDIIERIEELENNGCDLDEHEELEALKALAEEGEQYSPDWKYGSTLIHENYFEQYMDDLLEDLGDIPRNLPSYLTIRVDYDALKMDYTGVEFDGQTYFIR